MSEFLKMNVVRAVPAVMLVALFAGVFTGDVTTAQFAAHENDWQVWTAAEMERIGRSDPARPGSTVSIRAARNEYEAFQIVVTGGARAVTGVNVEVSDMTGPGGSTISRDNFTFYRELYIEVTSPSPDPGLGNRPLGRGWYPDALLPFANNVRRSQPVAFRSAPFNVGPRLNQPVWVDVHVPLDAVPGTYSGLVTVYTGQQRKNVPVSLRVWSFALPLKPTLQSSFGLHEPSLTDRRIHEVLLQHRLMPESVNPGDATELYEKFGLNGTGLRFWGNFRKQGCTMDAPPSPAQIRDALRQYPPDLPVFIYSADEIDRCPQVFNTVRNWAAAMHAADARIRNLVAVAPVPALYSDGAGNGRSGVDIWAILPKVWEADQSGVHDVQAKGGEIWSYTALVQDTYSPKWEIDFSPVDFRIQPGFISQSLGLTGILYWRVDLWTGAPYQDLRGYSIEGNYYPGEGMLVYPGAPAGLDTVIPSMRLKWIREGVDDFEYVAILKRLGRTEWALQRARRVGANWRDWTHDIQLLDSVRTELGDEIERLSGTNVAGKHE